MLRLSTWNLPETLTYYPESIDVVDDQFVIRVSDGVKSDDLIVNVIMIWDSEGPLFPIRQKLRFLSFFEEVNIGFENV